MHKHHHDHIELLFRAPALTPSQQAWDIRIKEFQRQILCEGLSLISTSDTANAAKLAEARGMLLTLMHTPKLQRQGINLLF